MVTGRPKTIPSRRTTPPPSNDNLVADVHWLTAEDLEAIIDEHGSAIGAAIDAAAEHTPLLEDPIKVASAILITLPDRQRWIVWYGSNLRRQDIDKLQEGGSLVSACAEVIATTKAEYDRSLLMFLLEQLGDSSEYLTKQQVTL